MKNPHAFLITTSATIAAGCAVFAIALAPVDGNRAGTASGFSFFAAMAGAGVALTAAATADALTNGGR
jgi:hypothetical protein